VRDEKMIDLRPGEPMVFGKEHDKGIRVDGFDVKLVPAAEATVWDPTVQSPGPAFTMAQLDHHPDLPNPMGILRSVGRPVFEDAVGAQVARAIETKGPGTIEDLIYAGDTWTV
jgi:2-oxoglutarate ferredoxin oxidoreductase subunit beta